ncbi:endonuclease [Psychroserpens mesophilus]|uniref:endonuclease n=1 Tax=Psychroserpens mesophilus TaxID=325473 RepID=UPI00058ED185|nr:endonuclease [Psychroserpens mesophilus]
MKHFYTILITLFTLTVSAQIPAGYYDYATGTGYTLKTQLKKIINDIDDPEISNTVEEEHNPQSYNALDNFNSTYERDYYYETNGDNTILDMYSENPTGSDPYTFTPGSDECGNYNSEGDCYNKEHVIPQSVFSSQAPMYSDAHHLIPADGRVNGFRGNFPFGRVNDSQLANQSGITNPTQNGSKLGNNLNSGYSAGYSNTVFEPIDEFKGDIARIYFYFVTRYEDQVPGWSSYPMFVNDPNKGLADPFLNILITWHQMDPVSQKEIDRNNNIFYNHQNNRNPFVDHPEYVALIWDTTPDTEAPTDPTNLVASNPTDNSIDLTWTASTDNIAVASYDIYVDGTNTFNTTGTSFTATGLTADTNYCFTVKAKDASGNESDFSNQDCETTTNNGSSGGDIDIFFSEYLEGSGSNKALEIANFTGSAVSLSVYTIKLSANGSGVWTSGFPFPNGATITNGDVYVVANGGANDCSAEYNYLNNDMTSFNGNDAIGLFKNDVLLDIIGELGNSAVYAENTILVRKPTVDRPTTTFDIVNEWDIAANCDDLGEHTQTLSLDEVDLNAFKVYPNPVNNILHIDLNSSKETQIEVYNVLGKRVISKTIHNSSTLNTEQLTDGIYILRVTQGNSTISKKLIKN